MASQVVFTPLLSTRAFLLNFIYLRLVDCSFISNCTNVIFFFSACYRYRRLDRVTKSPARQTSRCVNRTSFRLLMELSFIQKKSQFKAEPRLLAPTRRWSVLERVPRCNIFFFLWLFYDFCYQKITKKRFMEKHILNSKSRVAAA